jgi:hypothetical protein
VFPSLKSTHSTYIASVRLLFKQATPRTRETIGAVRETWRRALGRPRAMGSDAMRLAVAHASAAGQAGTPAEDTAAWIGFLADALRLTPQTMCDISAVRQ